MYREFFNLHTMPFENTPDPRFFYASEQHREALAAIEYTIRMRKGYVLITGDIGAGKTTIGRTMCERCASKARIVQVLHGHASAEELLGQILRALGVKFRRDDDHGKLLERLQHRLMADAQDDRPVVLFIDEAQTLSDKVLEELRLLSNFDTASRKLVQVVLVGHPELRQRIRSPRFDALRQRIVLAKQLQPLSLEETKAYIAHRVRAASADPENIGVTFSDAAIRDLHGFTGGVPRLLNFACDNCLLLAYVRESREITPAMVNRVAADMLPSFEEAAGGASTRPSLALAGNF